VRIPAPREWPGRARKHKGMPMRAWSVAFLAAAVLGLSGCGYNNLQAQDENVKAAWSEVVNQYQRRADLVPNLVSTVKGFAAQEQKIGEMLDLFAPFTTIQKGPFSAANTSLMWTMPSTSSSVLR